MTRTKSRKPQPPTRKQTIQNWWAGWGHFATGIPSWTRTHWMSSIPDLRSSARFGLERAPNVCIECHTDQTAAWAVDWMETWWPESLLDPSLPTSPLPVEDS
jgi:hypothetical protein